MTQDLVLLTGANGMIGFQTLAQLLEAGYSVRAAVRTQASFDKIRSMERIRSYLSQLSGIVVPDIAAPGAYDEAVQGARFIIHVASPAKLDLGEDPDYEHLIIRPAVQGTVGMLLSASKTETVEKVVITGSFIVAVQAMKKSAGINDVNSLGVDDGKGPMNPINAYITAKARAFAATKDFLQDKKPKFTATTILPVFTLGRNDMVTDVQTMVASETNGLLLRCLLGTAGTVPPIPSFVHVDDVARMHVLAMKVEGNQDFNASGESRRLTDAFGIVKRRFPRECSEGVFSFDDAVEPAARSAKTIDSSDTTRLLETEFKSFEEQVVSVVDQYLELRGAGGAGAE